MNHVLTGLIFFTWPHQASRASSKILILKGHIPETVYQQSDYESVK